MLLSSAANGGGARRWSKDKREYFYKKKQDFIQTSIATPSGAYSSCVVRRYSTKNQIIHKSKYDSDFLEWFRGFTDAEGSFVVRKVGDKYYLFSLLINLHPDDVNTLIHIKETLGFGDVKVNGRLAVLRVNKQEDIKLIIEIFNEFPLNTTKHLNFLCFKKAWELYTNSQKLRN